ncbi:MAG: hypothetical protein JSS66_05760 [Armatimonadetes bacterium]|nr:hypothetical protein [Armatimonadota bacterium]
MKFKVYQFYNQMELSIREVEVPDDLVEAEKTLAMKRTLGEEPPVPEVNNETAMRDAVLNLVFKYGQNEVQNKQHPSVSVGDIIEYRHGAGVPTYYVVAPVGFLDYGRDKWFMFRSPTEPKPKLKTT